jgi:hypothetical protein
MLNFFTTSNGFRSTLPVVSNLTAMNVWDGVCMCFIYASLLEFVCVNYVGRKRPLHNVVYRPGENPVTQVGSAKASPLSFPLSPLSLSLFITPSNSLSVSVRERIFTIITTIHPVYYFFGRFRVTRPAESENSLVFCFSPLPLV